MYETLPSYNPALWRDEDFQARFQPTQVAPYIATPWHEPMEKNGILFQFANVRRGNVNSLPIGFIVATGNQQLARYAGSFLDALGGGDYDAGATQVANEYLHLNPTVIRNYKHLELDVYQLHKAFISGAHELPL